MKYLIEPDGWPCKLAEYDGGHFIYEGQLCFKTEYHNNGYAEAYNSAGEYFHNGTAEQTAKTKIQPVKLILEQ